MQMFVLHSMSLNLMLMTIISFVWILHLSNVLVIGNWSPIYVHTFTLIRNQEAHWKKDAKRTECGKRYQEQNQQRIFFAAPKFWKSDKFFPIITNDKKRRMLGRRSQSRAPSEIESKAKNRFFLVFPRFYFSRIKDQQFLFDIYYWCWSLWDVSISWDEKKF